MEYFKLCLKVIEKELKKFNLGAKTHSEYQSSLTALFAENYDIPYNRCAFMSCYAPINILNFKDCVKKFFFEYSNAQHVLCEWKSHYQVNVCSLSTGPGLDFLAFILALIEYDPLPPRFNEIKILSKYVSWQNTIDLMSEVLNDQESMCGIPCTKLSLANIKIVKTNYLVKCFSKLHQDDPTSNPLRGAHIVLLMKTLNLTASAGCQQETKILQMLKELLYSLRSDAIIFCLDTTPSTELFEKALSCFSGKMLYGPIQHTFKTPAIHSEALENLPPTETGSTFFAWRKSPWSLNYESCQTSFELACSEEDSVKCKPTTSERSGSSKDCPVEEVRVKFSEILPWRELPLGKVPWGEIFWENMSSTSKKSLKNLMTLDKKGVEHHWIGETINLYVKELESQSCSSQANLSSDSILVSKDVVHEDAKLVPNDQTELLTSNQIFTSENTDDDAKKVFMDNTKLLPETFKQCTNSEPLYILQNDNISNEITCSNEKYSLVEEVNLFLISKNIHHLTDSEDMETKFYPEIQTINQNISIEKEILFNYNTDSLLVDNVNSFGLLKDASHDTNSSQSLAEATNNATKNTEISSKVYSKIKSVPQNISLNMEAVQETIQEASSQDITEDTDNIDMENKINSKNQLLPPNTCIETKVFYSKSNMTVCQKSVTCKPNGLRSCPKRDKKYSEILPWKELPPGIIPWGEIFWQNSSLKMKKSLKCVFSNSKETLDRHWIGDVARLYIEEFGKPDLSTPLSKKLLYREQSANKTKECPQDFNKTSDILLNIPQPGLISKQVNTAKSKLNSKAENVLIQIGDPRDIALTDNCNSKSIQKDSADQAAETLKEVKNTLPLKLKENQNDSFSMNKLKKVNKTWNDLLIEPNVINKNPTPAVFINNLKDKSFETKSTQTDFSEINPVKNNLALVKALTESVQQLITSFEKSTVINYFDKHCIQACQAGNKTSYYNPNTYGASQPPINPGVTNPTSAPRDTFLFQNKCSLSHCFQPCMGQLSCSRCDNQPLMHSCSMNCHSQWCNVAGCGLPLPNQSKRSSDQSYVHLTSQNLVIPVQGVSDDALLKIMSLIKNN